MPRGAVMFVVSHGIITAATLPNRNVREITFAVAGSMFPDMFIFGAAVFCGFFLYIFYAIPLQDAVLVGLAYLWNDVSLPALVGKATHSYLVCMAAWAFSLIFLRHSMFFYGWANHIVVDVFSHPPPHEYLWPLPFGIPWINIWHHEDFWQRTLGNPITGALLESTVTAVFLLPIFFLVRKRFSR